MQTPQPTDLRQKASRFRELARASAKAILNHYADRFTQQAREREQGGAGRKP